MTLRRCFLFMYRVALQFYPSAFRRRFVPEMLELAKAAEPAEWPLFLGDTGVAIIRCWIEGSPSTAVLAEPNAYLALGGSSISASGLVKGLVLSFAVTLGLCYAIYLWPPACPMGGHRVTPLVDANPIPVQTVANAPESRALSAKSHSPR